MSPGLKRALYLDPFEWIISYNLGFLAAFCAELPLVNLRTIIYMRMQLDNHFIGPGLVHLNTGQFASVLLTCYNVIQAVIKGFHVCFLWVPMGFDVSVSVDVCTFTLVYTYPMR